MTELHPENDLIRRGDAMRAALHYEGDLLREMIREIPPVVRFTPPAIEPKTVTWSGVNLEDLKKAIDNIEKLQLEIPGPRKKLDSISALIDIVYHMAAAGKIEEEIQRFIDEETVFGTKRRKDDE